MAERLIVRQNKQMEVDILASNPANPDAPELVLVEDIYDFTPYTLLLASLGTCTTILIHSYAQNHNYPVDEAEVRMAYQETEDGKDEIVVFVDVKGKGLSDGDRTHLIRVSEHCSIHKVLDKGVPIHWGDYQAALAEHEKHHHHHADEHEHDE